MAHFNLDELTYTVLGGCFKKTAFCSSLPRIAVSKHGNLSARFYSLRCFLHKLQCILVWQICNDISIKSTTSSCKKSTSSSFHSTINQIRTDGLHLCHMVFPTGTLPDDRSKVFFCQKQLHCFRLGCIIIMALSFLMRMIGRSQCGINTVPRLVFIYIQNSPLTFCFWI